MNSAKPRTSPVAIVLLAALLVSLWAVPPCPAAEPAVLLAPQGPPPVCRAGQTCEAAFKVTVKKGFHINALKPADPNLIASKLSLKAFPGISLASVLFPEPGRVDLPALGGIALVHDGTFEIKAKLALTRQAPVGLQKMEAILFYQACDNQMCFMPAQASAKFKVEVKKP